jgi:adenosylmethionine-8-amino-7-oxononanoate aminotransferase
LEGDLDNGRFGAVTAHGPSGRSEDDLLRRDARVLWHPFAHAATEPELLPVVKAHGAVLELADGRQVLDAISSWWTTLHGHGEPSIARAVAEQVSRLDHVVFAGATHPPAVALAEALVGAAPRGLDRVFFSDDGSTAVEVALKIAIQSAWLRGKAGSGSPKQTIVALEGGYHGDTFGAMATGDDATFTEPFRPYLFRAARAPVPNGLDDLEGTERCLRALEKLLDQHAGDVAAILTEPILQGAGGMRLHPPAFLRGIRRLCDERGILWIADEVLTGFGRTGRLFACEHARVTPDLLCLAKGLTGGVLPLAATLCSEALYSEFQSGSRDRAFFHGHSFTANPVACAAGLASFELSRSPFFLARAAGLGAKARQWLDVLAGDPRVKEIRSLGMMAAVELTGAGGYLSDVALRVRREAARRGVLLRPLGRVVYVLPPACISDSELETVCGAVVEIVRGLPLDGLRA